MKADYAIAVVLTAGALYLFYHIALWATRATTAGLPL